MTDDKTTPQVPDGKTTREEMVKLGWQDISGRKGPARFLWRDTSGRIIANAKLSHQGFAEMELVK